MRTDLQRALGGICGNIRIHTIWSPDPECRDIRQDCDGFENENPEDWTAWQVQIIASAIEEGIELAGAQYMGGIWERAGDDPRYSNPDISGYEAGMTIDALAGLEMQCGCPELRARCRRGIDYIAKRQAGNGGEA
jgi:hypothetical protein